jgi:hypothetical protein
MFNLTSDLANRGERDTFRLPSGCRRKFVLRASGSGRRRAEAARKVPNLHIDTLKVKSGNWSDFEARLQRRCGQKQGDGNAER